MIMRLYWPMSIAIAVILVLAFMAEARPAQAPKPPQAPEVQVKTTCGCTSCPRPETCGGCNGGDCDCLRADPTPSTPSSDESFVRVIRTHYVRPVYNGPIVRYSVPAPAIRYSTPSYRAPAPAVRFTARPGGC